MGSWAELSTLMKWIMGFSMAQSIRLFLGGVCFLAYFQPKDKFAFPPGNDTFFCARPPQEWLLAFGIDSIVGATCIPICLMAIRRPSPLMYGWFMSWFVLSGVDHLEGAWMSLYTPFGALPWIGFTEENFGLVPFGIFLGHAFFVIPLLFNESVTSQHFGIRKVDYDALLAK